MKSLVLMATGILMAMAPAAEANCLHNLAGKYDGAFRPLEIEQASCSRFVIRDTKNEIDYPFVLSGAVPQTIPVPPKFINLVSKKIGFDILSAQYSSRSIPVGNIGIIKTNLNFVVDIGAGISVVVDAQLSTATVKDRLLTTINFVRVSDVMGANHTQATVIEVVNTLLGYGVKVLSSSSEGEDQLILFKK